MALWRAYSSDLWASDWDGPTDADGNPIDDDGNLIPEDQLPKQVNDVFKSNTVIDLPEEFSDAQVIEALYEDGFLSDIGRKIAEVDNNSDRWDTLYILDKRSGSPLCEIRKEDSANQSRTLKSGKKFLKSSKDAFIQDQILPALVEPLKEIWEDNENVSLELVPYEGPQSAVEDGSSREGYFSTSDGSITLNQWTAVSYLASSGYRTGNPKMDEQIARVEEEVYKVANEQHGERTDANETDWDDTYDEYMQNISVNFVFRIIFHEKGRDTGSYDAYVMSWHSISEYQLEQGAHDAHDATVSFSDRESPEEVKAKILREATKAIQKLMNVGPKKKTRNARQSKIAWSSKRTNRKRRNTMAIESKRMIKSASGPDLDKLKTTLDKINKGGMKAEGLVGLGFDAKSPANNNEEKLTPSLATKLGIKITLEDVKKVLAELKIKSLSDLIQNWMSRSGNSVETPTAGVKASKKLILKNFKASDSVLLAQKKKMSFAKLTSSVPIFSEADEENPTEELEEGSIVLVVEPAEGEVFISKDGINFTEVKVEEGDFEDKEELPEDSLEDDFEKEEEAVEEEMARETEGIAASRKAFNFKVRPAHTFKNVRSAKDGYSPSPVDAGKESDGVEFKAEKDRTEKEMRAVTPDELEQKEKIPKTGNGIGGEAKDELGSVPSVDGVESGEETAPAQDTDSALVEVDKILPTGVVSFKVIPFVGKGQILNATSVFSGEATLKAAKEAGIDVHQSGSHLFRGKDLSSLFSCITKWVRTGDVLSTKINKTIVYPKENMAMLVKSSRFTLSLIKASLVPGLNSVKYSTFVKMGKLYVSSCGHVFDESKMLKMGYPKYVVIAQSAKTYFEKKGVSAGDYLQSSLDELDRTYFRKVVSGYQAKLRNITVANRQARVQSARTQAKKEATFQALLAKNNALRSSLVKMQGELENQKRINSTLLRQKKDQRVVAIADTSSEVSARADILYGIMNGGR